MFKHLLLSTIFLAAMANPALAQLNPGELQQAAPVSAPGERVSPYAQRIYRAPVNTTAPVTTQAPAASNNAWQDTAPTTSGAVPYSAANYPVSQTEHTSTQGAGSPNGPNIKTTTMSTLDKVYGGSLSLPPTVLDSFVQNAGGQAFQIYGDEGTNGPPPLNNFNYINDGIKSGGLTTGHQSGLPSSWDYPQ